MEGLSSNHQISLVETSYYGEVLTVSPESSNGDTDITITGRAVERNSGSPMPAVPLNLVVSVNGFERTFKVFTDGTGAFSYTFTPTPGESGLYKVCAIHPDLLDRPGQGQFVINRISIDPGAINLSIPRNYQKTISLKVTAGKETTVNNLRLVYDEADQPEGMFPKGVYVEVAPPVDTLGSGQTASLDFTIWADNNADETGKIVLKVVSGDTQSDQSEEKEEKEENGADTWGSVTVNTYFSESKPVLYYSPDYVETGVALGETVSETVTLENRGTTDLNDVVLAVVSQDAEKTPVFAPAPAWVHLNSAANQGAIKVGEKRQISISFSPVAGNTSEATQEGIYSFYLQVASSNCQTANIGLYASVTQSGIGNVQFKVFDIYTGTVDQNNEVIQGMAGAKVTVQNEEVLSVEQTKTTDNMGEVLFTDLPVGRYKCRITADKHQEYIGTFWIKPGITANKEVFLEYNLVTVEWEVVENTIQDKYEVVLKATYETDVPAPVVVVEPASINLPKMKAGDVYQSEFTLTNYGLIRAKDLHFMLPADDQNFKYELLTGMPDSLGAKERITVPYRVTCLRPLDQEENQGSGGGCKTYIACIRITYTIECAYVHPNGDVTKIRMPIKVTITFCLIYIECDDIYVPTVPTEPVREWPWIPEIDPNRIIKVGPPFIPFPFIICYPVTERLEVLFDRNITSLLDPLKDILSDVGCTVNCVLREYNDDVVNLSVKGPGGSIDVRRLFYGNKWYWEDITDGLHFNKRKEWYDLRSNNVDQMDVGSEDIESIDKGGVLYKKSGTDVYAHDTYTITKLGSVYLWKDKLGNWKEYDINGRMGSYGTRTGFLGKILYEKEGNGGKLIGITDRNDRQVIWFEYHTNGQISAVRDKNDRRVEYSYADGRLSRVKDVLSHETNYEYDSDGKITKAVDAAGRLTIISYDIYGNVIRVVDSQGHGYFFQYNYDKVKKEYYAQIKTSSGMVKEVWYDSDGETKRVDINGRTIRKIVKDGRNLIITDEKGNVTRKEFDEWKNVTKVTYPNGFCASSEYEHKFNQLTKMKDTGGNITKYQYDDQGNLIKKTEAVGTNCERVTTYTCNEYGQPLTVIVAADAHTESASITMAYDIDGNLVSTTDPMGNVTEFLEYDNMGDFLKVKYPQGHIWKFAYDDMGRLTSQIDPLNNTTAYKYDGANNRTAIIDAQFKRFGFEYDDHNNLIKVIDPYGKYSTIEYNTDSLPIRIVDREGKQTQTEYDNERRIIKSTDGAGNQTTYKYDETEGTPTSSDKPVQIDYPTYSRKLYYDKLQRVIRKIDILDDHTSHSSSYTYDEADNVTSETDEEGNITRYEYDALNRLIKIIDPLGGIAEGTYDNRDNLITLKDPKGNITWYRYR